MFLGLKNACRQMKAHFDTPGAPRVESLNSLAIGMNRKGAALLFYQTCGTHPIHVTSPAYYRTTMLSLTLLNQITTSKVFN